ncbi:Hypothetical predicted protein [Marmota monax]|uniref:Uncharacterized protein n=1 Tax=Marmota monax TaxID=9995 RepID=A0A5E4D0U2_MARMO|nr:hypothetical protein GHT09_015268 [Marmota monax]VTJ87170.1 Hypothetical predicted protein [Marmota monax]
MKYSLLGIQDSTSLLEGVSEPQHTRGNTQLRSGNQIHSASASPQKNAENYTSQNPRVSSGLHFPEALAANPVPPARDAWTFAAAEFAGGYLTPGAEVTCGQGPDASLLAGGAKPRAWGGERQRAAGGTPGPREDAAPRRGEQAHEVRGEAFVVRGTPQRLSPLAVLRRVRWCSWPAFAAGPPPANPGLSTARSLPYPALPCQRLVSCRPLWNA